MIEGSPGTKMFQHIYASFDGAPEIDTVDGGAASCAYFVSAVLLIFRTVEKVHATVANLEADMMNSGWEVTDTPEAGDVIFWEDMIPVGESKPYPHVGFYVGNGLTVSNSYTQKVPVKHDYLFRDTGSRAIRKIYSGKHLMLVDTKIVEE